MTQYFQAVLTILSLVNPVICAAIFSQVTQGKSRSAKIADATKATLSVILILCLAALIGAQLLHAFGISLPAFQVAGGTVLVWMGFLICGEIRHPHPLAIPRQMTILRPLIPRYLP